MDEKLILTDEQMKAAHFVRALQNDDMSIEQWIAEFEQDEDPAETERYARETRELYDLGASVLKRYSLSYSSKFAIGASPPPPACAGWIFVSAGHIAASEQQRYAIFRERA